MPTPRDLRNTPDHGRIMQFPTTDNESIITQYMAYRLTSGRRWRPSTVKTRNSQLRNLTDWLHPTPLVEATEDQMLVWHRQIAGQPESVAGLISAARGLYRWMAVYARPRLRPDDPTVALERPYIPPATPRPMFDRHYDLALACAVSEPEMYLWLGLMGCCGLRCCEVAWMHTGDVELRPDGSGLLHVTGKGGKRRVVPAGSMLMLTMKPFLTGQGPLFTRPSDRRAHTPHSVSKRVSRFLSGVGIPPGHRGHSLRHRFGTDLHALDPDLYRQAKIMGHASVDTTQRYTEVDPVEAARHIETLTTRRLRTGQHRHRPTADRSAA